jgi:hypothetical protein
VIPNPGVGKFNRLISMLLCFLTGFPLHVEYAATEREKALGKVIRAMDEWGERA